jgi:2,4-dienoyl-CoA reductase-like NADH-dependent reductase (Old Yellow Enzyme family)
MFLEDGCNVKYAAEIKKHVKTPVATVGALCDPELMEEIIASGKADVVEIARASGRSRHSPEGQNGKGA